MRMDQGKSGKDQDFFLIQEKIRKVVRLRGLYVRKISKLQNYEMFCEIVVGFEEVALHTIKWKNLKQTAYGFRVMHLYCIKKG